MIQSSFQEFQGFQLMNAGNSDLTQLGLENRITQKPLSIGLRKPKDRKLKRGSNPLLVRGALISLLLMGSGFAFYQFVVLPRSERDRQLPTVQVNRRTLPITVSANGSIEPERSINVSPVTSGRVKRLLVEETDTVEQGQIIAYMDDSTLQGQLIQAQGQLASAEANLQLSAAGNRPEEILEAQAKLEEAQASLRQAESTFQQDSGLYKVGAIAQRELQTSKASLDTAQARASQAEQALTIQQAGSRREEIARYQAEVEAARGNVAYIRSQIENTIIRAPFSGVVIRKYAEPGAFVAPTTSASAENSATSSSILALGTKNQVVANVAETSIGRMRVGQPAIIKVDAFPGRQFKGQVKEIAPQSTVEQNVTSFEVKVALTDADAILRSGMNVDVEFQVGELNQAVMIPTPAIVRRESGTGVYVQTAQEVEFQLIETGTTVGGETEIVSGLEGNEKILLSYPEGEKLKSGPTLIGGDE
jgi:HlyD family secretion protein